MPGTTSRQWTRLVRAASDPAAAGDPEALLRQAMALGHDVAPDAVGCSITTLDGTRYTTPVYSGRLALDLDLAQYQAGDGPCMATAREHRHHDFDAATDADRFPGFTEAALGYGVRSSISLPLSGSVRPSAINLYGSSRYAFDGDRPRAVADLLARCVAAVLARQARAGSNGTGSDGTGSDGTGSDGTGSDGTEPDGAGGGVPADRLALARDRARLIAAAETALMDSRSVSRPDALDLLMRRSRVEVRSIFDVARDVVEEPGKALP